MKFTLVFILGLCVFAANAQDVSSEVQPHSQLIEKLKEISRAILMKVQEQIEKLLNKAEDVFNKVADKVQKVTSDAEQKVWESIFKILEQAEKIAEQSEEAQKCVEVQRLKLKETGENAQIQMALCATNSIEQSQNIVKNITSDLNKVIDNVDALDDIVQLCFETHATITGVFVCVTKKTSEITKNAYEIVKKIEKTVTNASSKSYQLVRESSMCVATVTKSTQAQLNEIKKDVQKCV